MARVVGYRKSSEQILLTNFSYMELEVDSEVDALGVIPDHISAYDDIFADK